MGARDFKNLSGKKLFRKVFYPLSSPLQLVIVHYSDLLKEIFTVSAVGTGALIAILCFKMFNESIQLLIIQLDEIPDLQVEYLP